MKKSSVITTFLSSIYSFCRNENFGRIIGNIIDRELNESILNAPRSTEKPSGALIWEPALLWRQESDLSNLEMMDYER